MTKIRFENDGWTAIIADEFTFFNLRRIAQATSDWMVTKGYTKVLVGYDSRFGGKAFADAVSSVIEAAGHLVYNSEDFITSPMLSLGIGNHSVDLGIIITASHLPSEYSGLKFKSRQGGSLSQAEIQEIEALIPKTPRKFGETQDAKTIRNTAETLDLESEYMTHVLSQFSIESFRESHLMLVYDAIFGAGQKVFPLIIPEALRLRCENNPSFQGATPEPVIENLQLLSQLTEGTPYTCCGFATDSDAHRIGLLDEYGKYVDSSKVMLLLIYYLSKYQELSGKVVGSFAITDNVKELSQHFGHAYEEMNVGLTGIAKILDTDDILLAGEASGGFIMKGHILDKDGIWTIMCILDLLAKSGKTISTLLDRIHKIVRKLEYQRKDIFADERVLSSLDEKFGAGAVKHIGKSAVSKLVKADGYKFYLNEDEWVMIRPSGKNLVLSIYTQAKSTERTIQLVENMEALLSKT